MEQDLSGAIIEGVGNDVLLGFGLALIVVLLSLAWSSTNLTNSQARLSPVRIQRSNVELNRHINSSTTDVSPNVHLYFKFKLVLSSMTRILVKLINSFHDYSPCPLKPLFFEPRGQTMLTKKTSQLMISPIIWPGICLKK